METIAQTYKSHIIATRWRFHPPHLKEGVLGAA